MISYNASNGKAGKLLYGCGSPSNRIGNNNDFYVDTDNNYLYGPKNNYCWSNSYINLTGEPGPRGPIGPPGDKGPVGSEGGSCQTSVIIIDNLLVSETVDANSIYTTSMYIENDFNANSMTIVNLNISDILIVNELNVESLNVASILLNDIIVNNADINNVTTTNTNVNSITVLQNVNVNGVFATNLNATNTTVNTHSTTNIDINNHLNTTSLYVNTITIDPELHLENLNEDQITINYIDADLVNVNKLIVTDILVNDTFEFDNITISSINVTNKLSLDMLITTNIELIPNLIAQSDLSLNDVNIIDYYNAGITITNDLIADTLTADTLIVYGNITIDDVHVGYSTLAPAIHVNTFPMPVVNTSYFKDILPIVSATYDIGTVSLPFGTLFIQENPVVVSDARKKRSISDSDLGLDFINKIRTVKYKMKNKESDKFEYGMIAQEVRDAEPKFTGYVYRDGNHFLRYSDFISPLIKANQELYAMLNTINSRLDSYIKTVNNRKK